MNPDKFHAHLDVCRRCRDQPFNLCPEGVKAIHAATLDDGAAFMKKAYGKDK